MVRGSSDLISLSKVSSLTLPNLSNLVLLFPNRGSSLNFLIKKSISLSISFFCKDLEDNNFVKKFFSDNKSLYSCLISFSSSFLRFLNRISKIALT